MTKPTTSTLARRSALRLLAHQDARPVTLATASAPVVFTVLSAAVSPEVTIDGVTERLNTRWAASSVDRVHIPASEPTKP